MAKSALVIGVPIVAVVILLGFIIIFYPPSSMARPEIRSNSNVPVITPSPSSKVALENQDKTSGNLSLIQIFEKTESGVVRVNVQKTEESGGKIGRAHV